MPGAHELSTGRNLRALPSKRGDGRFSIKVSRLAAWRSPRRKTAQDRHRWTLFNQLIPAVSGIPQPKYGIQTNRLLAEGLQR